MKAFNNYINSEKEYLAESSASETKNALRNIERLSKEGPIKILNLHLGELNTGEDSNIKRYFIGHEMEIVDDAGHAARQVKGYEFSFTGDLWKTVPTKINAKFKITKIITDNNSANYILKFVRQAVQLKEELEKIDPKAMPLKIYDEHKTDRGWETSLIKTVENGLLAYK